MVMNFSPSTNSNTVTEDFESVVGPPTDVKEIHITPVQEGKPLFALVRVL